MYLKSIELQGFKSFANNTVLNFEKGITGIVGPNGSGKSNIADAVRWVLGEQKIKQLRGASMQDVIFAGTENRKAQGFAYVSLVIDNKDRKLNLDYDEIQVSRRLYKSGDSEYKLNNVDCRLRDINELFYDTGIGKEGYSIIGQGQIDKIISSKPEDKRELFDEASGIVKFKRRKAVAEKKLEEAKLNSARIADIVNELEKQVGPLAKQAETAKVWVQLHDDLVKYEANNFVMQVDKENEFQINGDNNLKTYEEDLKNVKIKKQEFTDKYTEIELTISKLDQDIALLKDSVSEKNTLRESLNGKINVLREQINSENVSDKTRLDRIETLNQNVFKTIGDIENTLGVLMSLKKQIEFIKANNEAVSDNDDLIEVDLSRINVAIDNAEHSVKKCMGDDYNLDMERCDSSSLVFNDEQFEALNDARKQVEGIDNKINDKEEEVRTLSNKMYETNQKLVKLNEVIMENQNIFHSNETKLETIKNMLERYEGYQNVCKNIMDEKDRFGGIKGVVADLFDTEQKYELAIETALGNSIQNIVTKDVDTAKKIFTYLNENKLGRITVLPLTSIVYRIDDLYENAKKENGVIDIAVNLVKYDSEFSDLAKFLLGRCLIVDNFDNAKVIFEKYKSGVKLVTLNGELFNPGGALTGGKYKNQSNLMGRKREFEELKSEIDLIKNKIDKLNTDKNVLTEDYDKYYSDIDKAKNEINTLTIEKNTKTLNIVNDIKMKYSHISNKTEWLSGDMKRLVSDLESAFFEKSGLEDETTGKAKIVEQKENEIKGFENDIVTTTKELQDIENTIADKSNEKEKLLSNRSEYYRTREDLGNSLLSLEKEIFKTKTELEKSTAKLEEISSYMYNEYSLTYNDAKEKYVLGDEDENELKKLIKDKKKAIADLGPINIDALEQYKEVSERYETTTTQFNDCKASEEEIAKIVEELDASMRAQFEESFKNIKVEFDKVFKELFGGGVAKLELIETNEGDELDAGVNIVVQPPGKKLGNMMQLSGGEKALTAIALLFAIQNLKPSPFCLLDEIEAALDESNVDRFAGYLNKLTEETQFILITHRRGTMEKADRLYGITMQEKGVTALVSVDLVQDELK